MKSNRLAGIAGFLVLSSFVWFVIIGVWANAERISKPLTVGDVAVVIPPEGVAATNPLAVQFDGDSKPYLASPSSQVSCRLVGGVEILAWKGEDHAIVRVRARGPQGDCGVDWIVEVRRSSLGHYTISL